MSKLEHSRLRYLCEPLFFLYSFGIMLEAPTLNQFVYYRFSEDKGFHYSYTQRSNECESGKMNVSQKILQEQVQTAAAQYNIFFSLFLTLPSLIMSIFYGPLSDVIGRRCIIFVVLIGSLAESLIVLSTMFFKLPVPVIFVGYLFGGIGGGISAMLTIVIAYTADISEKNDRSVRIGIMEASLFLGMTLSHFSSGPLIESYGFTYSQLAVTLCHITSLLYAALVLKEPPRVMDSNFTESMKPVRYLFREQPLNMWRTLTRARPNRGLLYLSMGTVVSGLSSVIAVHPVLTLYLLNRPFCWPAIDIGNIMGVYFLVLFVGVVLGMKILVKCLPEWFLSITGFLFTISSFLMFGFAKNTGHLYGATVIRLFGGVPTAIFRGNISRSVDEKEQGAIFSITTSIEMLLVFCGISLFSLSYAKLNVVQHPGLFFLIPSSLMSIPLMLAVTYWIKYYQAKLVQNISKSEKNNQQENEALLNKSEKDKDF